MIVVLIWCYDSGVGYVVMEVVLNIELVLHIALGMSRCIFLLTSFMRKDGFF